MLGVLSELISFADSECSKLMQNATLVAFLYVTPVASLEISERETENNFQALSKFQTSIFNSKLRNYNIRVYLHVTVDIG